MQDRSPRFFVILACLSLLLCQCGQGILAQESADLQEGEALSLVQSLTALRGPVGKPMSGPPRMGVEILPAEAQQLLTLLEESNSQESHRARIRKCLERLQKLLAQYTAAGRLDEAFVLRESLEEYQARQAGVEPDPGNLTAFRDQTGKTHMFRVTGRLTGSVWGSGVYTDDSDLGTAAVHAGLLRDGQRGVVKVTLRPGQEHYDGSEANGVTSSSYESWQGSYVLARDAVLTPAHDTTMPEDARKQVDELMRGERPPEAGRFWTGLDSLQKMQETAQRAQNLDQALAIREGIRAVIIKMAGARPDPGNLAGLRAQTWKSFTFVVTGRANGSVWGSGIYTDDSDLGTAAVHAGLLRPGQPGIVKVTIRPGCEEYEGSESNGVTSSSYAAYPGSYQVSAYRLPAR